MAPLRKAKGIFLFVDDDPDEIEFLKIAARNAGLQNEIVAVPDGMSAYRFLLDTPASVFMIISEVHMPHSDGLDLKRRIELNPDLKLKSIPFFFHSSMAGLTEIRTAYSYGIQGYFEKSNDIAEKENMLRCIVELWTRCVHPNDISLL